MGGGGLDVDGLRQSWGCGHNGRVRKARLPGSEDRAKGGPVNANWSSERCNGLRVTDMAEHH